MAKTWNTPDTIHDVLSFWRSSPASANSIAYPEPESTRAEIRRFYTLGGDLNAHPDLVHGGVIACLLDSTLGRAIFLALSDLGFEGESQFTVQLNVTYKKAVKTPSTVVARAWVTGLEGDGRKIWAKGSIEGENGVVFAEAEGMWLRPKVKKAAKI
jgi:acyl-coenzyme A thioesterase PaaI-like protein